MKKLFYLLTILLVAYGCEKEKSTNSDVSSEGALSGYFSISENKQIRFSRGNLQYNAGSDIWRFAEHQWDVVGADNVNIKDEKYEGWIDLFGFGTASNPMNCIADHWHYGSGYENLSEDEYKEMDWGWHNKIFNGGNKVHSWRTLTRNEFIYLMQSRSHAEDWTFARVNDILGIIIVPDDWETPQNINYVPKTNTSTYTISEWKILEDAGAVFLPAAGWRDIDTESHSDHKYRTVTLVEDVGVLGRYWTATCATGLSICQWRAIPFLFDSQMWTVAHISSPSHAFMFGYSVRLVQDVK